MATTKKPKPESVAVSPTSTYRVPVTAPSVAAPAAAKPASSTSSAVKQAYFGAIPSQPQSVPPPVSAYGTSSAQYGQVSPTGVIEVPPIPYQPTSPTTKQPSAAQGTSPSQPSQTTNKQLSAAQGTTNNQVRRVTINNPDGSISNYDVDPKYSYISQTGKFEFDFWTPEGQKERILNALETMSPRLTPTAFAGKEVPVAGEAATVLIDALNLASILYAGTAVYRAIAGMNKVGSLALTANGAKSLAGTIPEASGIIPKTAPSAGQVIANTKNAATGISAVTQALFHTNLGRTTIGGILVSVGLTGATQVRKDVSDYIKDSGELALKLREAGMNDMADELVASNKDLKNGFDVILPYIPYLGKNIEEAKIQGYIDKLNDMNNKYDSTVKAEKEQEIAEATIADQQAAEVKRQQELADLADKRAYEEKTLSEKRAYDEAQKAKGATAEMAETAEQRAYNEEQKAEQRAYNEQQTAEQRIYDEQEQLRRAEAQAKAEATATESTQGSTLTFGLLNTGGAVEFVDKDKAAQVYFGKVYEELTPEQQMLLNLLKGGGK